MKIENVEKLVANLHDKTEYVIHIRNLKQALNHGLILRIVNRVIKFNQNLSRKPSVLYPEFFWAYWYMYRERDFNESTDSPTNIMALFSCFLMPNN